MMLTLEGHSGSIRCLAYAPDSKMLASGSYDTSAILWDLGGRHARATLPDHGAGVYALAFAPDGKTLATAADNVVRLWSVPAGKLRATINWPARPILALAFSPDGTRLVGTSDTEVVWCNPAARPPRPVKFGAQGGTVWWLAFAPDGQTLATADSSGETILWDVAEGKKRLTRKCREGVRELTYFPDGKTLALTVNWCVRLRDAVTLRETGSLTGHRDGVQSVAVAPDGTKLITGSWDKTVRVWDAATLRELSTFDWGIDRVLTVAYSPDGMTAAAGGEAHKVVVWDVA
jgi:hypothetical protein